MHMNIISMHGRNATMGSNPAALSQFQFRTTPDATTAPEKDTASSGTERNKVPRGGRPSLLMVTS
jgi:hypothetical protein